MGFGSTYLTKEYEDELVVVYKFGSEYGHDMQSGKIKVDKIGKKFIEVRPCDGDLSVQKANFYQACSKLSHFVEKGIYPDNTSRHT